MTNEFANQRVVAQCLSGRFDAAALNDELLGSMRAVRYRDIISIELPRGEAVVFPFGAMVFWGATEDDREALIRKLAPLAKDGRANSEEESFGFELGADQERFHRDTVFLADASRMQRLAVSHALAQSVKLNQFERQALTTIQKTASIPQQLGESGRIRLSQRDIAQMRGNLFLTKSDIILNYDLLDTPEFFWEYPELEATYEIAARYLEIKPRVEVLSKKLETIHELLEMLADEQKHKHSSNLEWTIIWLIAIEIVFFLSHDIFGLI